MKTSDRILRSALKLFASQGIDRTSTAQITRDAGLAEGTLFVHFSTKQKLIDSLYITIKRNSFSEMLSSIDPKATAEENTKRLSRLLIEYYLKNYSEMVFMEQVEGAPQVSEEALAAGSDEYRGVSIYMENLMEMGEIKKLELGVLQNLIWAMVKAIVKSCRQAGTEVVDSLLLDAIWDAVRSA